MLIFFFDLLSMVLSMLQWRSWAVSLGTVQPPKLKYVLPVLSRKVCQPLESDRTQPLEGDQMV